MKRRSRAWIVLAAVLAAGCGSASKTVFAFSHAEDSAPLERVAVFLSIPARGFDRGIYHGFQRAMASKLASCGVKSKIFAGDPPADSEAAAGYLAELEKLQPTARLTIKARGGKLKHIIVVNGYGSSVNDDQAFGHLTLTFRLELLDLERAKATWKAVANLDVHQQGTRSGEELADSIVARLRTDGVLKGCR